MKFIKVPPDRVGEIYDSGRQCLIGAVPVASREDAIANKNNIYVRPIMTPALYSEYVELVRKIAEMNRRKGEIESFIQQDGEIVFTNVDSQTASVEFPGFSLDMTKSLRVALSDAQGKVAFDLVHGNPVYIASKVVYDPSAEMKNVIKILTRQDNINPADETLPKQVWERYLEIYEELGSGRKVTEAAFIKALSKKFTPRVEYLEKRGFDKVEAVEYATLLEENFDAALVEKVLKIMDVRDIDDVKVETLLQCFSVNEVISFTVR